MTAAGFLADAGIRADVYEYMERPGRKLGITGKGRCNVTNNCPVEEVIANIPTNPRFLYGALNSFSPADTMDLFERLGVPLKTERGNRVFPQSDKARDIVDALCAFMRTKPINERVRDITHDGDSFTLKTDRGSKKYDKVLVATGGASYPRTGSTGDGYKFAKALGHTVTPLVPSLIPLETAGNTASRMMGLSLRNVAVTVVSMPSGKAVYTDFGEMMFAHFGITGPVVLSASSHMRDVLPGRWRFEIDLKPALDREKLDKRLLSDFEKYRNRDFINSLGDLLPSGMIEVFVEKCGISPHKKVNSITREERSRILDTLKHFSLDVTGTRPISEAIITSGGVSTKEITPKTMESKKVPGLYFAGEVIDVDAYTGGFNLQIAFSTAVCAARAIINSIQEDSQ